MKISSYASVGIPSTTTIVSISTGAFGLGVYTLSSAQTANGVGVNLIATIGTCSVADAPLSNGYVYPGIS
jgi:hypothetical protein